MPALLVRQQHSRFQLRRPTAATKALGVAVLLGAGALLLIAVSYALDDPRGIPCPALFGVCLALFGSRLLTGGALLLETMGGSTYVASLDRQLQAGELKSVRLTVRGDEVDVVLELADSTTSATQGALSAKDPEALAKQLHAALGVPVTVTRG